MHYRTRFSENNIRSIDDSEPKKSAWTRLSAVSASSRIRRLFVITIPSCFHLSNSPSETSSRRRLSYRPFNMCLRTRALSRRSEVTSPREVGTKRRLQKSNYVLHRTPQYRPSLDRVMPIPAFAMGRVTALRDLI